MIFYEKILWNQKRIVKECYKICHHHSIEILSFDFQQRKKKLNSRKNIWFVCNGKNPGKSTKIINTTDIISIFIRRDYWRRSSHIVVNNSISVREVDKDIGKDNCVIFSFKQLMQLQVEREEDKDRPMRDKIELRIFEAGLPKWKCL